MSDSNHKLYLGMFSFQLKKRGTSDSEKISINDFLSQAYPEVENKFQDGFAEEIISLFEKKTFKNKKETHGGTLEEKSIASVNRYFDIVIDGGLTGIQQFIVDTDGSKQTVQKEKIIGLKFYARFWMPAGGKTGYLFIQRYNSLSIKPLFDEIINATLLNHGFILAGKYNSLQATTTKKRLELFLKNSSIRDVTVISKNSNHDTGSGDAQTVTVKLKNIKVSNEEKIIDKKVVSDALKNHGFTLGNREYEMTATYESKIDGKKEEEKTTKLGASDDTINIIPNILLPNHCVDENGYPDFSQLKQFVDREIKQIKIESKI
ncbi:hypothetical protein [Belliella pelovolcani]|uniref:Type I secretion C-terminal target domain (VC_A0849 subclass) n=1 Tax=Belliella pelovolcani TaxID=529505 RepID=A0A1N7Q2T8_9BACT|nr:hypothetical protein [Belliella pelovolcani]SIT17156.1 type I secretion C-terminal target domain (VC_A0849 subclass) [Belliella pelovolcani]